MKRTLLKKVGAEIVGTFALVFAGCGAIMVDETSKGALGHLGVATVFGLVVCVMVCATGHVSGAHFNPAVTLAFASTRRFPWREVPAYVGAQLLAAVAAAAALSAIVGPVASLGSTTPKVSTVAALLMELIITFLLMFVITAVATDSRAEGPTAGPAIGGTVALCALFAGPLTGASMNPARTLGPALLAGEFTSVWIYVVAPVIGAVLGACAYHVIRCDEEYGEAKGCC